MRRSWITWSVAITLVGCRGDDAARQRVTEQARGEVDATPEPGPPTTPYSPVAATDGVVGHVRIGDPFAALAKVSAQLSPPSAAGELTIDAVRATAKARAQRPLAKALADGLDPSRPLACALLEPARHSVPVACVFGYAGGLAKLVEALGPEGRVAAEPGSARYDVDGLAVHLDALGPDVVVAFDDTAFRDARAYLEALARPGGTWDVDLTLFPSAAATRHEAELELIAATVLAELAPLRNDPAMRLVAQLAARELSVVAAFATSQGPAVVRELLDGASQVDRIRVGVRLDDAGLRASVRVEPDLASGLRRELSADPAIAPASLQWIPRHTWWAHVDAGAPTRLPRTASMLGDLGVGLLADRLGLDPEATAERWRDATRRDPGVYGPGEVVVAFNGPDTWGGAAIVRPLQPDASGRDAWLTWGKTLTADQLLERDAAKEVDKIVRWAFRREARVLDGVPVDRFEVTARRAFTDKLAASLREDAAFAELVVQWVARKPALVAVDRFEAAGHAAFVLAPGGGDTYAPHMLALVGGDGRAALDVLQPHLDAHPRLRWVLAVSVRDLAAFAHELLPADLLEGIPPDAGRGLGDVFAGAWITETGEWEAELVVDQQVLDLVRQRP